MSILPTPNIQAVGIAYGLLTQEFDDSIEALRSKAAQEAGSGNYIPAEAAIAEAKLLETKLLEIKNQQNSWTENYTEVSGIPPALEEKKGMIISYSSGEICASASYGPNGKTTLHSGSTINAESQTSLSETVKKQRSDMLKRGDLHAISKHALRLCVDLEFGSPSGAAVFVRGFAESGPRIWRVKETGETLAAWEQRTIQPLDLSKL